MLIKKGDETKISADFKNDEFLSKAPGVVEHELDDRIPAAFQIIRSYFGVPLYVTSTYRPAWYNALIPGASATSRHITKNAGDGSFNNLKVQSLYNNEIITKGPLYKKLKAQGINGFGIYDNKFHIDTRNNYTLWDKRDNLVASNNPEDGVSIKPLGILLITTAIIIITISIYKLWKK